MRYLKCRQILKRTNREMNKSLAGIRYIMNDYIKSEDEFCKTMKRITCIDYEIVNVSTWINTEFPFMDSVTKSALLLGISKYRKDAYSYKYASIQMKQETESILRVIHLGVIFTIFIFAGLLLRYWLINLHASPMYPIVGLSLASIAGCLLSDVFIKNPWDIVEKESFTDEKIYLRKQISSLRYNVSLVEGEIYHNAFRYWNTCMAMGCRRYS